MIKKKETKRDDAFHLAGILAALFLFLLLGIIGGTMLFYESMRLLYFVYVFGGFLLTIGLILMIYYFVREEYKIVSNYHFAAGMLLLIAGICTLIRAGDVAEIMYVYLGILIVCEGVIMLQHAIQLKTMQGTLWLINLVLALIFIALAVLIIIDFNQIFTTYPEALYTSLLVIGISGIFSQITVAVRSIRFKREMEYNRKRNEEEDPLKKDIQSSAAALNQPDENLPKDGQSDEINNEQ